MFFSQARKKLVEEDLHVFLSGSKKIGRGRPSCFSLRLEKKVGLFLCCFVDGNHGRNFYKVNFRRLGMKRIQTADILKRKARKNKIIMGVVLVFLLVFSTLGYSLMNNDDDRDTKVNENGLDFYKGGGLWRAVIDGQEFGFQYLPSEVESVPVEGIFDLGGYASQPLYFVNVNEAAPEILNNLQRYIMRYQEACINESACGEDFPLKDCSSNVIIYEAGNDTKVYKNQSCVYLVGDAIMAADAFLYETLHI